MVFKPFRIWPFRTALPLSSQATLHALVPLHGSPFLNLDRSPSWISSKLTSPQVFLAPKVTLGTCLWLALAQVHRGGVCSGPVSYTSAPLSFFEIFRFPAQPTPASPGPHFMADGKEVTALQVVLSRGLVSHSVLHP